MNILFKKRAGNVALEAKADLVANRIATKVISYQTTLARHLQRIINNVPIKIQGYAFTAFACLSLFYCGWLIFGTGSSPLLIKTIQPLKETRISSADSLHKLENIYQHYLKR
jgi:hypothetical protein